MFKQFAVALLLLIASSTIAQNRLTPELLWKLGRVAGLGLSKDGKYIVYSVSTPNAAENKSSRKSFILPIEGGQIGRAHV